MLTPPELNIVESSKVTVLCRWDRIRRSLTSSYSIRRTILMLNSANFARVTPFESSVVERAMGIEPRSTAS